MFCKMEVKEILINEILMHVSDEILTETGNVMLDYFRHIQRKDRYMITIIAYLI